MRLVAIATLLVMFAGVARAGDADPRRKVIVLEYRAGSSSLPGIAKQVFATLAKHTSLDLLGPDQTRAVFGDHLDQVLVKCGGEAACIAGIGQKVGAAEVILVGVSELGDVILTMQRIDVRGHAVRARIADSLPAGAHPSEDKLDEYLAKLLPATDFLRFGMIDIVASEAGAAVTIGGKPQGVTPIAPLKLHAPDTYDIKIVKTGFVPFSTRVRLPPDGSIKVEAELSRRGHTAWYQHWYVLAAAGVLVAGAAGTTIYYTTQTSNDQLVFTGSVQ